MSIGYSNAFEYRTEEQPLSHHSREYSLWSAVLLGAIDDLEGDGETQAAAKLWFNSPSRHIGSFLWLCEALGLNASAVRRTVRMKPI